MKASVLTILYIAFFISACKKESLNYSARMTILNSVPDASSFDVYAGGGKLNAITAFGKPDYYLSVPAITDSIKWKISSRALFDSAFVADLPNGRDFTVLFYDSASRLTSYMVKDDWQQPASDKQGYYRFFPMIVNANALKITNDTGKTLMSGRGFGDFQKRVELGSFSAIDSFTTKLKLYNNNVLIDSIPGATIVPGKSYTIYGVGVLNATGDKRPRFFLQEHQ